MTLLLAIAISTSYAQAEDLNHAIVHAGYGGVLIEGAPLHGFNAGLQYRSSIGALGFDAEPISVVYDNFGESTGVRIGFISPGVRGILFPERTVSPSLGAGIGFNFTGSESVETGIEFAALQTEARFSAAVEFWRQSGKAQPTFEVLYVVPLASISNFPDRQPHTLMARLGFSFPTRVSAMNLVDRWFN